MVPFGFRRYFFSLYEKNQQPLAVHLHALFMGVWCILLIVQPLLIRYKKPGLHQLVGKTSYVVAPLLSLSMLVMIKLAYLRGIGSMTDRENLANLLLPFSQMVLFSVYYAFAIGYRHKPKIHRQFIIISSLTLLGPTIGRFDLSLIGLDLDMVNVSLLIMEVILVFFIVLDLRNQTKGIIYFIALMAYSFCHFAVYYLSDTNGWQVVSKQLINTW
jgi:hypothetical protein